MRIAWATDLHQGANHSFLDIHIDYNLHPIKKLYRKLNLIIFVNEQWENGWGGHLNYGMQM
ncbi:MAG: 2OG-Fe(II) oxygenase [Bacteroidota bacterium]